MNITSWTTETYAAHNDAMRKAESLHNKELRKSEARHNEAIRKADDRRYGEVNVEKEKALKIKETADLTALELARESQVYKDERNDAMREQNLKETGVYATRDDLAAVFSKSEKALASVAEEIRNALKPMIDHIAAGEGASISTGKLYAGITVVAIIMGVIFTFINKFL